VDKKMKVNTTFQNVEGLVEKCSTHVLEQHKSKFSIHTPLLYIFLVGPSTFVVWMML
jgi:hypothetical protein